MSFDMALTPASTGSILPAPRDATVTKVTGFVDVLASEGEKTGGQVAEFEARRKDGPNGKSGRHLDDGDETQDISNEEESNGAETIARHPALLMHQALVAFDEAIAKEAELGGNGATLSVAEGAIDGQKKAVLMALAEVAEGDMPRGEGEADGSPQRERKDQGQSQKPDTGASLRAATVSAVESADVGSNEFPSPIEGKEPEAGTRSAASELLKSNALHPKSESGNSPQPALAMRTETASEGRATSAASAPAPAPELNDVQVISERSTGTVKTLVIRLDPIDLGMVTARIRLVTGGIEVHLVADRAEAAQLLAADRDLLDKALRFAGASDDAKLVVTVQERGQVAAGASSAQLGQHAGQSAGQQSFNMQQQADGRGYQAQSGAEGQNAGQGERHGGSARSGQVSGDETLDGKDANASLGRGSLARGLIV